MRWRSTGNIEAMVGTARVDVSTGASLMTDDRATNFAKAERTLTKVLSAAPQHAYAHAVLGLIHIVTNRAAQGIAECERALALDRIWPTHTRLLGLARCFWVVAQKLKSMSKRRFGSLPVIPAPTYGCRLSGQPTYA